MNELLAMFNSFAELWWSAVVRASLQGGLALLTVWLLVRTMPRLSPRVRCWFWRLAYLKLFLALVWWSPVELPVLPAPPSDYSVTVGVSGERSVLAGLAHGRPSEGSRTPASPVLSLQSVAGPTPAALETPALPEPLRPALSPAAGVFLVWLLGVAWCAQRIGAACRAARLLRNRSRPVEDPSLLGSCEALSEALQLRRRPELTASEEVQGPMLLGGRSSAIVLPEALAEHPVQELQLILAHELAHLRRGDLRWNWLPAAAHTLFFFHPLVWIAGGEWRLCQEMACDELALAATRAGAGDYGEMLLKVAASAGRHPRWGWTTVGAATQFLGAVWSDDSPQVLRRRLQMLRHYRLDASNPERTGKWSHPTMAGALLATAGLCLVPWQVTAQDAISTPTISTSMSEAPPSPADTQFPPAGAPVAPGSVEAAVPMPGTAVLPAPAGEAPDAPESPTAALPGASSQGALSEQWEDVLLLEAMRYLGLSVAQTRGTYPLAGVAQRRLKELAEQDRRVEAALARIARQSREALLAGQPGTGHKEALQLEDGRRRKRARSEEELLDFLVPKLADLLTREQIIRACLLTVGEPPQEQGRTISPALLNPEAGFVLGAPVVSQPSTTLRDQVNERLASVRSRWEERRQAAARKELSGRYPQKVVDSVVNGSAFGLQFLADATITSGDFVLSRSISDDFTVLSLKPGIAVDRSAETPEMAAVRKEWEAIQARTNLPFAQLLVNEASPDELRLGLRAFTRRMFLSPRIRPVLEARLRLR